MPPPLPPSPLQANSYLVLHFVADNPGVWLMHCHIEWHMFVGLNVCWVIS